MWVSGLGLDFPYCRRPFPCRHKHRHCLHSSPFPSLTCTGSSRVVGFSLGFEYEDETGNRERGEKVTGRGFHSASAPRHRPPPMPPSTARQSPPLSLVCVAGFTGFRVLGKMEDRGVGDEQGVWVLGCESPSTNPPLRLVLIYFFISFAIHIVNILF